MSLMNTTLDEDNAFGRLSEYSDDVNVLVEAVARLDLKVEDLKEECKELADELAGAKEELAAANKTISELRDEVASLEGDG